MWTPGKLVKFRVLLYEQPSNMYGHKNALTQPKMKMTMAMPSQGSIQNKRRTHNYTTGMNGGNMA